MSLKSLALFLAAAALAVSPAAADRRPARVAPSVAPSNGPAAAKPVRMKPTAPVTLTATARETPAGWQIVVDAAPTRAVGAVELEVAGQITRFGATAAKRSRRLVVPVAVAAGTGQDVVVVARVGGRSTAQIVRVGAPAPVAAKPAVTVRVIDGITFAEVRQ